MKYMHFNSSCSYAGLANMLALQNYDTEDYKIALEMGLPYFIRYDINSNYYQAGAMLQSKEWFELYLKPRGFRYIEKVYSKDQLITNLRSGMMFGIQATLNSKHAIVFIKEEQGIYSFLNNKWEESSEEEYIYLKASELLEKVPENIAVGYIERCNAEDIDVLSYYEETVTTWRKLQKELQLFTSTIQSSEELRESMNRLFRPLLVDTLAMMGLLNNEQMVSSLKWLQDEYLKAVKKNESVILANEFDCTKFNEVIDKIIDMVYLEKEKI